MKTSDAVTRRAVAIAAILAALWAAFACRENVLQY